MGRSDGAGVHAAACALFDQGHCRLKVRPGLLGRDDAYRAAASFFDASIAVRLASRLPFGCGYMPYGTEHSGDAGRPDEIEGFVASTRTAVLADRLGWQASALHAALLVTFDRVLSIAEDILIEVAARCGLDRRAALRNGLRRWSLVEIHRAGSIAAGDLIHTPHEDGHFLTFAHATAAGLEIEIDSDFQPVDRTNGGLFVMAGSALTLMTGGLVRPVRHLVRSTGAPRTSMMVFVDLDPALCTPWRAAPSNAGIDIGAHVLGNSRRFGAEGFSTD